MHSAGTISSLLHVVSTGLTHMSGVSAGTTGMTEITEVSGSLSPSRRQGPRRTKTNLKALEGLSSGLT